MNTSIPPDDIPAFLKLIKEGRSAQEAATEFPWQLSEFLEACADDDALSGLFEKAKTVREMFFKERLVTLANNATAQTSNTGYFKIGVEILQEIVNPKMKIPTKGEITGFLIDTGIPNRHADQGGENAQG